MLQGAYTAIVTPFDGDGNVDYGKFEELIEAQIEGGVDGIVPVGTTGESPTLSFEEHNKVVDVAVRAGTVGPVAFVAVQVGASPLTKVWTGGPCATESSHAT